ncbi:hypothetical protein [Vallitalea okinawensis]|uniref:hypothetical protein n=1 Tax=Vallitalea okinawensis TaxID=2078660 RepID=UPI000CFC5A54|nr:hypothetical protein [Vallitalea okinawensis]
MYIDIDIIGGKILIDKKVFAKEMLKKGSYLRQLTKSSAKGTTKKDPAIIKEDGSSFVIIDYNDAANVSLNEDFDQQLTALKEKYSGLIKGRITISLTSHGSVFHVFDFDN